MSNLLELLSFMAGLLYKLIITLLALSYLVFFGVGLSLLSLVLSPLISSPWLLRSSRGILQLLLKIFFFGLNLSRLLQVDAKELDQFRHRSGIIFIANHPSLMDALFFSSRLPNVIPVMKSAVLNNPIFFGAASLAGFIRSDSAKKFIINCQTAVAEGSQLLFFPEGTRTKTRSVNSFKGGFAMVAKGAEVTVQTVFIAANSDFLSKGWPLWKWPAFPLIYRIQLGESFQVDASASHKETTVEMENYFKNRIPDYQQAMITGGTKI